MPGQRLARAIAAAVVAAGAPAPASIGLVLSDDAELAELNFEHMATHGPTDVLSFPLLPPGSFRPHEGGPIPGPIPGPIIGPAIEKDAAGAAAFALPPGRRIHLGDIVVSVERAAAQASDGRGGQTGDVRWTPAHELLLLVTHGALHVCGWDHAEPREEAAMRMLERTLLGAYGQAG